MHTYKVDEKLLSFYNKTMYITLLLNSTFNVVLIVFYLETSTFFNCYSILCEEKSKCILSNQYVYCLVSNDCNNNLASH